MPPLPAAVFTADVCMTPMRLGKPPFRRLSWTVTGWRTRWCGHSFGEHEMEVQSPPGVIIGSIKQDCSVVFPYFSIRDSSGNVVLRIVGPFCTSSICCNDVVFYITTRDGITKIGQLSKNFNGLFLEALTDVDNFTVTFPIDLDVKMKATLLGAVFLIDFMFFESAPTRRNTDLPGNIIN